MTDLEWFVKIVDWQYDHLESVDDRFDLGVWQAIAAKLLRITE